MKEEGAAGGERKTEKKAKDLMIDGRDFSFTFFFAETNPIEIKTPPSSPCSLF